MSDYLNLEKILNICNQLKKEESCLKESEIKSV